MDSRSGVNGSHDSNRSRQRRLATDARPRLSRHAGTPCLRWLPASYCAGAPGGTVSIAAFRHSAFSLTVRCYPPVSLTGPCIRSGHGPPTGACGVGSGGIQKDGRLPYAEQASLEIDRQFGKGLTLELGYLFVGAHKLVRGNNINVPCPFGTSKAGNPAYAQGLLIPAARLTACAGNADPWAIGLGSIFWMARSRS